MSINRIAKDLNTSCATVSNALAGRGRMRKELRDRILAYADRIGFRPNINAARLRHGSSRQILFAAAMESSCKFDFNHAILIHHLTNLLIRHDYDLVIHPYENTPDGYNRIMGRTLNHSVDGIILQTDATMCDELLRNLAASPVPVVNFDTSADAMETPYFDSFTNSFMDGLLFSLRSRRLEPDCALSVVSVEVAFGDRLIQDFCNVALLCGVRSPMRPVTIQAAKPDFPAVWQELLAAGGSRRQLVLFFVDDLFESAMFAFNELPESVRKRFVLYSARHKSDMACLHYADVAFAVNDFQAVAEKLVARLLLRLRGEPAQTLTTVIPGNVVECPAMGHK